MMKRKQFTAILLSALLITSSITGPVFAAEVEAAEAGTTAVAIEQITEESVDTAAENVAEEDINAEDSVAEDIDAEDAAVEDNEADVEDNSEEFSEESAEETDGEQADDSDEEIYEGSAEASAEEQAGKTTENFDEKQTEETDGELKKAVEEQATETVEMPDEEEPISDDYVKSEAEEKDAIKAVQDDASNGEAVLQIEENQSAAHKELEPALIKSMDETEESVSIEAAMDMVAYGTCGDNLTWTLDEEGTLTITGTGGMTNYTDPFFVPWSDTIEQIKTVVIEKGITGIGRYAFKSCENLTSITIPNSVTSIGSCSFNDCSSLTSITIPESVTSIGDNAFAGCSSLTSITIPDSITSIELGVFGSCIGLTSVSIPSSVTNIGEYAFCDCVNITDISIPSSVINIADNAFFGCDNLSDYYLSDLLTWINFTQCFPQSENRNLYLNNELLTELKIPEGVTSFGEYAFYNCSSIRTVTIPSGFESIGIYAFDGCSSLEKIDVADLSTWLNMDVSYCEDEFSSKLYIGGEVLTDVVIPEGITEIRQYAFAGWGNLKSITIPYTIKEIAYNAFMGCDSLTDVFFYHGDSYGTLDEWNEIDFQNGCQELENASLHCFVDSGECGADLSWVYYADGTLIINGTGPMTDGNIPWSSYACFYSEGREYSIQNVVIENGVTSIGNQAFWSCGSLINVAIPETVTRIGIDAFNSCWSLNRVTIPDSVTSIGERAFSNCGNLKELKIPENVTIIEESSFSYCEKLENIQIPENVISIMDGAFSDCSSLTGVTIPQGVTSIGDYAFARCSSLSSVEIPSSVESIGQNAFLSCNMLANVTISEGVTNIYEQAFSECTSLENVIIPEGITGIADQTFYGCTSLRNVSIPLSTTYIGSDAFYGCTSLAEVNYAGTPANWNAIYIGSGNDCLTEAELHCADSGTTEDSGKCGEDLTWSLDEEGTLTISGTGQMYSYKPSDGKALPWPVEKIKTILIEEGATSIGDWAFLECENLTSVTIPEGVTSIGESAFDSCGKLKTVTVPSSLKTIGDYAFFACYSLERFDFPEGLLEIGGEAFSHCNSLKSVTIPSSVTKLGAFESPFRSFLSCSSLERIDVDPENGVFASVDGVLFSYDKKELICCPGGRKGFYEIPSYVEDFGPHAFYGCTGLTGVSIPDGVRCIYVWAFMDCTSLAEVVIPSSVTEIEQYAFCNCKSLEIVNIPKDVSFIARYAFEGCIGLTDVYYDGTESEWNEIEIEEEGNEPLFNAVLHFQGEHSHSLILIDRVEPSGENAGHIAYWLCTDCGKMFSDANGSMELLPDQVIIPAHGGGSDEPGIIVASGTCGENVSWSLNEAGTLTISGEGYQENNPWHPYYTDHIRNVVVEDGITYLEEGVFDGCMNLVSVTLPEGLKEIPNYAFSGCIHLTELNIPDSVTFIGKSALSNCDSLINVDIPSSVETISLGAFSDCSSLRSVTISDGTTEIDGFAFSYCSNLRDVTIPKSVTTIWECAFKDCINLTTVYYTGTEADWDGIRILNDNDALIGAALHFITYDLSEAEVTSVAAAVYTGTAITPKPVVKMGDLILAEGTDYTLSYANNKNAGTATVTITGIGKYEGSTTATFKINKAAQTITTKAAASSVAVGKTTTISTTGNKGTVTYKSADTTIAAVTKTTGKVTAKKVGTVKITATAAATDNYKAATKTITIKIVPAATAKIVTSNLAKGIKLTWKKVDGATGYKVYRGSTLLTTIKSGSTVTFTDAGANTNGTKYSFKVYATASTGTSPVKSVVTYRIGRPVISSASNTAAGKMTVKWARNAKATGYYIQYCLDKTFETGARLVNITNVSTVSKVISGLTKGKTYYVRVRTYKTVDGTKIWSAWSITKTVKITK